MMTCVRWHIFAGLFRTYINMESFVTQATIQFTLFFTPLLTEESTTGRRGVSKLLVNCLVNYSVTGKALSPIYLHKVDFA